MGWIALDIALVLGMILIYIFGVHKQFTKQILQKRKEKEQVGK